MSYLARLINTKMTNEEEIESLKQNLIETEDYFYKAIEGYKISLDELQKESELRQSIIDNQRPVISELERKFNDERFWVA